MLELKISKLQELVNNAKIIDESMLDMSKVLILSTVELKNLSNGSKTTYTLVPENEANLKLGKISVNSPIAKGLLGKKAGDKVEINVPAGILKFEILSISY
jgi:transcription elongation factor GreA